MARKRLISLGVLLALLAFWTLLAQFPAQSVAQEPAGPTAPFYQRVFGLGSQNPSAAKPSEKIDPANTAKPPAGIALKKPAAIPLPKRSMAPTAPLPADATGIKASQQNAAATDKASVQKAIDLINRTYRAEEGASPADDQPSDLERQMLAPFLPGASATKNNEPIRRASQEGPRKASKGAYTQGTIQFDDPESEPVGTQEKSKRPAAGSWLGQGKKPLKSQYSSEALSGDDRSSDPRTPRAAAKKPESANPRFENQPAAASNWPAASAPTERQTYPGFTQTTVAAPTKISGGKAVETNTDGSRVTRSEPAKSDKRTPPGGFFFPSRWFGPTRKELANAANSGAHLASGKTKPKGEFASETPPRTANDSALTRVGYESAAPRTPAAYPGEVAMNEPPAPGRSQFNEGFPAPGASSGEGPELPAPYPTSARPPLGRQPLPRGNSEPETQGLSTGNGSATPNSRSPKPPLSGRGEMLPFPSAGSAGPGAGYSGAHDGMRVPPGGFSESEMASEPDGSLELPAPRLANAPEAKIRGLIQALGEERQKLAAPRKEPPALKDAGLDENQRLKWRIELAMEKVMAEKNRGPGYDAMRDGNATGPIGIDLWERARSYYDRGDFVAAMETLRALEKTETRGELIMPARFLLASCLVQSGRPDDASKILRELAATPNDRVIADLAQWRLSQIRSRMQLEKTLEEVRTKSLRLTEMQH